MQAYYQNLNTEEGTWQERLSEVDLEDLNDFRDEASCWCSWTE